MILRGRGSKGRREAKKQSHIYLCSILLNGKENDEREKERWKRPKQIVVKYKENESVTQFEIGKMAVVSNHRVRNSIRALY